MGWARFDDGYTDHPKIKEAGKLAELLDMRAIIYCARYETDGLVTKTALRHISHDLPSVKVQVSALLRVGRWSANETGGWLVNDFLKYNPSKAAQESRREAARVRMNKSRTRSEQYRGGDGNLLEEKTRPRVALVESCGRCGFLVGVDCDCPQAEEA